MMEEKIELLYKEFLDAVENEDVDVACLKVRKGVEYLVDNLASVYVPELKFETCFEKIEGLSNKIDNFPINTFHALRKIGNSGVHDGIQEVSVNELDTLKAPFRKIIDDYYNIMGGHVIEHKDMKDSKQEEFDQLTQSASELLFEGGINDAKEYIYRAQRLQPESPIPTLLMMMANYADDKTLNKLEYVVNASPKFLMQLQQAYISKQIDDAKVSYAVAILKDMLIKCLDDKYYNVFLRDNLEGVVKIVDKLDASYSHIESVNQVCLELWKSCIDMIMFSSSVKQRYLGNITSRCTSQIKKYEPSFDPYSKATKKQRRDAFYQRNPIYKLLRNFSIGIFSLALIGSFISDLIYFASPEAVLFVFVLIIAGTFIFIKKRKYKIRNR